MGIFSDEKWKKLNNTKGGVAREAPNNIPPKRLLMVSRFLFMMMVLRIMDEDVAREAPNNIQFSQFYFHMQSLTSREVSGPPQETVRKTGSSSSS